MSLKVGLIIIGLLLVFSNAVLDGAVFDSFKSIAVDDDKEPQRKSLLCLYGLLVWPPATEVYGMTVPIPSFDDVLIAFGLASAILFFLHLIQYKIDWKHGIALYVVVWFLLKYSGYLAIQAAGPGCIEAMEAIQGVADGLYTVGAIMGVGVLGKLLFKLKK